MLVDSHCHLDFPGLVQDRAGVMARARGASVARFMNIGTTRRDFATVHQTALDLDDVYCTMGVHPCHVHEEGEHLTIDNILDLARQPKVAGIGETGLDYYYKDAPPALQQESFRNHIRAAMQLDLPIIVHSREAEEDTASIIRAEGTATQKPRGVMHCFSSRRILAEQAIELGFYISLSGILTFKKSQELRDIVRDVPLNRLLVETDAPYLAPEPYRGKTCEPAYVAQTARVLAEVKGVSPEEIAAQTTQNFFDLFKTVPRPS